MPAPAHPPRLAATELLRRRDEPTSGKVTSIELFFDLVFVFAVTQLSHALLADLTPLGALRAVVLFVAVWWVWIYTGWVTNWLDPGHAAVRALLFLLMLAGIVMAVSIPHAFADTGWPFALSVVLAQCGRSLFMIVAVRRRDAANMQNFQRILSWQALGGLFWVAGAALPGARLVLWLLAMAIEFASPALGFFVPGLGRSRSADWDVSGEHLAERCSLFVIIALGEALILTCVTFEKAEWHVPTFAALLASFGGSVAMWWIYFDTGAERGAHAIEHAERPGWLARLGYTYLHLPSVAGIVLAAVGDELVLAHPGGHTEPSTALVVVGGAALFILGNLFFKLSIAGRMPLSHQVGLLLLVGCAAASPHIAPLALALAVTGALAVTAAWETASLRGRLL